MMILNDTPPQPFTQATHSARSSRDQRGIPALPRAPTVGSDDAPDLEEPHLLGARDEVRLPVVQELDTHEHPDEVGLVRG